MALNSGIKLKTSNGSTSVSVIFKNLRIWNSRRTLAQLLANKGNRLNSEFYNNLIFNIDIDNLLYNFNYVKSAYEPKGLETLTPLYNLDDYYFKTIDYSGFVTSNEAWQTCDTNQTKNSNYLFGAACKSKNIS